MISSVQQTIRLRNRERHTVDVPLGAVLKRSLETIDLSLTETYKQITVRLYHRGVVLRGLKVGSGIKSTRQYRARAGQLILSRIDARHGAIGLVPAELDGAIVTNDFWLFDIDDTRVLPTFLDHFVGTSSFIELCQRASEGTTNRVRLQPEGFLKLPISLPPLADQQWIVARIEALAAKIEEARGLRHAAMEEADALTTSAMRRLFCPMPDWRVTNLEDACAAIIDNLHSNPVYVPDGIPCVRSPDVEWGRLRLGTALRTSEAEYRRRTSRGEPAVDDIVFVREGGGTGKAALVEEGQRFSLGQRVMMLRPDRSKVIPKFFLFQLLSPAIYEDQILPRSKGSASPHLNIGELRKFSFLLPALAEQREIVAYLDDLQSKVDAVKRLQAETQAELEALLPAVLDRAFKGAL